MTVRFRIRTSAGQELSFASQEMFEDFVRSGDLSPDDLVYDRETGSWSPARTHPTVLDIQYELEAAEEEAAKESPESGEPAGPEASDASADSAFGLSLAPAHEDEAGEGEQGAEVGDEAAGGEGDLGGLALTEEPSPEEVKRAYLEKLEAEREAELGAGSSFREGLPGFTIESDSFGGALKEPAPPPKPKPRPSAEARARSDARPRSATTRPEPSKGGLGRVLFLTVLLAILGAGGYLGYALLLADPEPVVDADPGGEGPVQPDPERIEVEPDPVEPVPQPEIPSTEAAVRERAQERYLASTQAELRELEPIPEVWPQGPYLSVPSDHPEVVDVWQTYLSTIQRVREGDTERYRTAYEAALDDAAVTGEARDERLERAMTAFAETDSLRTAHFDRVEGLATAAIQSHNALLEAEGLILHDATGSTGRSQGIGVGTSGRDPESQLLLDQVLELLEGALDADGEGPVAGETVREWVWDGFLDAATR